MLHFINKRAVDFDRVVGVKGYGSPRVHIRQRLEEFFYHEVRVSGYMLFLVSNSNSVVVVAR